MLGTIGSGGLVGADGRETSIDDADDRAALVVSRGDGKAATTSADSMFAVDEPGMPAEDPLALPAHAGQIRRLTIVFADLVDSTVLSTRVEPERYRTLIGRYHDEVLRIVDRYEGHIDSTKGDGLLAVFGYPKAHEDDARRAVLAGLAIAREVSRIAEISKRKWGIEMAVRVGVHRGQVYLDTERGDVYGLAANLAARVSGLASPGAVVVSGAVEPLVRNTFELEALQPAAVKGVEELIAHHRVIGERLEPVKEANRPLVGREKHRAYLQKAWGKAQNAALTTPGISFVGEPGIGKSRLAAVAAELVERSGGVALELTGSAFHVGAGLYPIRMLLERRSGFGRLTDQAERLRLLRTEVAARGLDPAIVVLLAPVAGIAPDAGYEPVEAEGAALYDMIASAVQDYLLACLDDRPGLLLAEDVHWFDPSTMEVLGSLLRVADGRLLVVITARPGAWLPEGWPVKVVGLKALTDEQAEALITALNPTLTPDERAAVQDRCDGVPFYIEQVVTGLDGPGVPEALYDPLFARLRASPNAVPVVEAAGVIGRHVDRALLGTVCTLSEADIDEVIDELENALVLEQWGIAGWRFRHELLREVAVELAPPSVRLGLHARVADALVGAPGDPDWGVVAGHYEAAERFDDAADAYQHATTAARRRGALTEARSYLTRALAQLERAAPGPMRNRREISVRMERGWLVAAADGALSQAAAADFERCLDLAMTDPLDDEIIETRLDLVESYVRRADLRGALQQLESLRQDIGTERPWLELMVDIWFGLASWLRGAFDAALSQLEQATVRFAAAVRPDVNVYNLPEMVAEAYTQLASTHLVRGDLASAQAALMEAEHVTAALGFPEGPFNLAYVRFVEIWLHVETGELDRAAVMAADVTEVGERLGLEILRLFGATWQATIRVLVALNADPPDPDALSAHIATMSDLVDSLRAVELNEYVTYFGGVLGRLLIAAGKHELARQGLDAMLVLADETELRFYNAELLRLRAHTHADIEARRADIAAALELARRQGATLFELRAALEDAELRGQPARAALIDVISRFPSDIGWPELPRARALAE
jgi:class 3 adenylate cyclase/tetratricopeptide (TPR) repeat protein